MTFYNFRDRKWQKQNSNRQQVTIAVYWHNRQQLSVQINYWKQQLMLTQILKVRKVIFDRNHFFYFLFSESYKNARYQKIQIWRWQLRHNLSKGTFWKNYILGVNYFEKKSVLSFWSHLNILIIAKMRLYIPGQRALTIRAWCWNPCLKMIREQKLYLGKKLHWSRNI